MKLEGNVEGWLPAVETNTSETIEVEKETVDIKILESKKEELLKISAEFIKKLNEFYAINSDKVIYDSLISSDSVRRSIEKTLN